MGTLGRLYINFVLWVALGLTSSAHAEVGNDADLPWGMQTEPVAEQIEHSGVSLRIHSLASSQSVEDALAFFREKWRVPVEGDRGPGFLEQQLDGWRMISRLANGKNIVVQLRPSEGGGCLGFLSEMDLEAKGSHKREPFELPTLPATRWISRTDSMDGSKRAETFVFENDSSVDENSRFYASRMRSMGWSLVSNVARKGTSVLFITKKGRACEIAINEQVRRDGSVVFANCTMEEE